MSKGRATPDYNLAVQFPELAAQWHPTENGKLTPADVTRGSNTKVWWKCPVADDHEWDASPKSRTKGEGCPCCSGNKVVPSNSLATTHPALVEQWDYQANGDLTPNDVSYGSTIKVWWKCGVASDHVWDASPNARTNQNQGCPCCSRRKIVPSNCLATTHPELAKEWHPTKNGLLTPADVVAGTKTKVWWKCDVEKDHEWRAAVLDRVHGAGCSCCGGQTVVPSNCLATTHPEMAVLWHLKKNLRLTPQKVTANSHKTVWWKCPVAEDHEWKARPNTLAQNQARTSTNGCPCCRGLKVVRSNCLSTVEPALAKEWHPTRNRGLTPEKVTRSSFKKVWWLCSKNLKHEWRATVAARSAGNGCPHCTPHSSLLEIAVYCELKSIFSTVEWGSRELGAEVDVLLKEQKIAIEIDGSFWHRGREEHDRKKSALLEDEGVIVIRLREEPLTELSDLDLKHPVRGDRLEVILQLFERLRSVHTTSVHHPAIDEYLQAKRLQNVEEYEILVKALPGPPPGRSLGDLFPDIAREWHPERNGDLTPFDVWPSGRNKVWWKCPVADDHEWQDTLGHRTSEGRGCSCCSGRKVVRSNCLATTHPEIAAQWHPTKNGDLTPADFTRGSNKKVWWKCPVVDDHEWEATINSRTNKKSGCRFCRRKNKAPSD